MVMKEALMHRPNGPLLKSKFQHYRQEKIKWDSI